MTPNVVDVNLAVIVINILRPQLTLLTTSRFLRQRTVLDADHRGGWTVDTFSASEPETSRQIEKKQFIPTPPRLGAPFGVIPSKVCRDLLHYKTRNTFCGTWYLPHSRFHKSILYCAHSNRIPYPLFC